MTIHQRMARRTGSAAAQPPGFRAAAVIGVPELRGEVAKVRAGTGWPGSEPFPNPRGGLFDNPWPPDFPAVGQRVAIFAYEVTRVDGTAQDIRT
jgi:hypothetical protein